MEIWREAEGTRVGFVEVQVKTFDSKRRANERFKTVNSGRAEEAPCPGLVSRYN